MITFDLHQDLVPDEHKITLKLVDRFADMIKNSVQQNGRVVVRFVDEPEIQRLNRLYREKDSVTDVLSFSYISDHSPVSDGLLGDVAICFEQAKRQAQGDIQLELIDLFVHGVLHVFGYDHERPEEAKVMFPLQDSFVQQLLQV